MVTVMVGAVIDEVVIREWLEDSPACDVLNLALTAITDLLRHGETFESVVAESRRPIGAEVSVMLFDLGRAVAQQAVARAVAEAVRLTEALDVERRRSAALASERELLKEAVERAEAIARYERERADTASRGQG